MLKAYDLPNLLWPHLLRAPLGSLTREIPSDIARNRQGAVREDAGALEAFKAVGPEAPAPRGHGARDEFNVTYRGLK